MKIFVTARPSAKEESVAETATDHFDVHVKEPPKNGRANAAIARLLGGHFGVGPSRVRLLSGFSSKKKVFEIL